MSRLHTCLCRISTCSLPTVAIPATQLRRPQPQQTGWVQCNWRNAMPQLQVQSTGPAAAPYQLNRGFNLNKPAQPQATGYLVPQTSYQTGFKYVNGFQLTNRISATIGGNEYRVKIPIYDFHSHRSDQSKFDTYSGPPYGIK